MTTSSATLLPDFTQKGRQASPDIQDIITGIVKLLNGNVNVQANTAPAMGRPLRPISTRINNRGPPRITDVPALPPDFDSGPLPPPPMQMPPPPSSSTRMPTPYPFDLPPQNSPIKPYINGVPLPEQLVPSGYPGIRRPINIPPWKRPQRRPPPRRPLPYSPYKPLPPLFSQDSLPSPDEPISFSNNSQDVLTLNFGPDVQLIPITDEPDSQTEIETNETITEITEILPSEQPPEKEYKDKEIQIEKKKDKNNQKLDKDKQSKYNIIINTSTEINEKPTILTSSSTVEPTVEIVNETKSENASFEGIGEATPVLDTSMLDVVTSTVTETTTSSSTTPTESLPSTSSSTTIVSSSTTSTTAESTVKKSSTAASSKITGNAFFFVISRNEGKNICFGSLYEGCSKNNAPHVFL